MAKEAESASERVKGQRRGAEAEAEIANIDSDSGTRVEDFIEGREICDPDPIVAKRRQRLVTTVATARAAEPILRDRYTAASERVRVALATESDAEAEIFSRDQDRLVTAATAVLRDFAPIAARLMALEQAQAGRLRGRVFGRGEAIPRIYSGTALVRRVVDNLPPRLKPAELENATLDAAAAEYLAALKITLQGS
jgi:hypothetical protein